jgi:hypothetical protein
MNTGDSIYNDFIRGAYGLFGIYIGTIAIRMIGYLISYIAPTMFTNDNLTNKLNMGMNAIHIALAICMIVVAVEVSKKSMLESPNDIGNTANVYYKVLLSLMIIWPVLTFVFMIFSFMSKTDNTNIGLDFTTAGTVDHTDYGAKMFFNGMKVFEYLGANIHTMFLLNIVDLFTIVKTFLLIMVVIYSGLTINKFVEIKDWHKYDAHYHLKDVFGSFIAFLLIVVSISLFNSRNLPAMLSLLIDYAAPLAILIISALLVVYTNEISLLSKKVPIAEVKPDPTKEAEQYAETVTKEVANANVFDGSDKPNI